MQHQTSLFRGQPDNEAVKMIQYYETLALEYDPRGYCVSTSEGKDSRVLGHLFRRSGVKHFYLHSITGIDPPELIYFQRNNFQKYKDAGYLTYDVMYEKSMWQMMTENLIPPMRNIRYCCVEFKEKRSIEQGDAILSLGVRKFESTNRAKKRNELEVAIPNKSNVIMPFDNDENRRTFEACYQNYEKRVNPLAYWTDADIWNYSKDAKLEQCCLYCEGFDRLGCIGCPMARCKGRKREFERWPGFEKLYVHAFDKMIRIRKEQGLRMDFTTGREWFDWWMSDTAQKKVDEDQTLAEGWAG